jgi:hypothetical protein
MNPENAFSGAGQPPPRDEMQGGGESPEQQLQMLAEALFPILLPMFLQAMSGGGQGQPQPPPMQ